jgi:hypothetical protein
MRCARTNSKCPPHFTRGAVALQIVAAEAARDQVLPGVLPAPRSREHMVDGSGRPAAVATAMGIPAQNAAPRNRNVSTARDAHVATQDDDRRSIPGLIGPINGMLVIARDNRRFLVHHEHDGSLERHDGQRLVPGIEDQCAHCHPFDGACTACRRSNAPRIFASQELVVKEKDTVEIDSASTERARDSARTADCCGV